MTILICIDPNKQDYRASLFIRGNIPVPVAYARQAIHQVGRVGFIVVQLQRPAIQICELMAISSVQRQSIHVQIRIV